MCGIVGYVGNRNTVDVLVEGLKRLEYRGYDSAGICFFTEGGMAVKKEVGKLIQLEKKLAEEKVGGGTGAGIGHTRWATHGEPSVRNAHPHLDCSGRFSVVHNGIIENHAVLKRQLEEEGHRFVSDTDTEVIVHLVEKYFEGDLGEAVRRASLELEGSFALEVMSARVPDEIVAVRRGSPLVIGAGRGEQFIASDVPALISHTREVFWLEEGELAIVRPEGVRVLDSISGDPVRKAFQHVAWDAQQVEKGPFPHFMLKEIYEQPGVIMEMARREVLFQGAPPERRFAGADAVSQIYLVACGTSWHAALAGKRMIEKMTRLRVEVDIASEFRYREPILDSKTITIGISQSGETADTLAALQLAAEKQSAVWAICNVAGSSLTRMAETVFYTQAGPEIGVASTKAFTSQLVALYQLACHLAEVRGTLPVSAQERKDQLSALAKQVQEILQKDEEIRALASEYCQKRDFLFMGRGIHHAIALEGALKLKEISYIHAEGYPAGEMKHGPIALIDREMPVVFLVPQDAVYEKVLGNIEEVRARGGRIIALAEVGDERVATKAHHVIYLPKNNTFLISVLMTIPLQLLAYHIALQKGCDVDQPRNLAKSVTVE
ncbi:MAG: glutamine--fructose-6-phosphate transaminase (isomerizing) [Candidatus Manganitrophaceae bacterium]|nr:MAG: glutamine--fructose-6-phosphate transaminase (isomerizing) [Candidatus Manganitrophaceae bacterium]